MIKTYYLARLLHKLHLSSFKKCDINHTSKVASGSALTKVKMGRYSYVGNYTHITDAVIGNFCSIGSNCGIGGGMHPTNTVSTSPVFLEGRNILGVNFGDLPYKSSKKVTIGNDVWIGECVYVMPGITIGDGAIIGAHAVVTKDVKPYSIMVGVPAKEIKMRFDDEIICKLQKIEWWNWSDEKLKRLGNRFDDPHALINSLD